MGALGSFGEPGAFLLCGALGVVAAVIPFGMLDRRRVVQFALGYLKSHPEEILLALANALRLKFGIPLEGLRWLTGELPMPRKAPKEIEIESIPPALQLGATVDAMGTPLRVSAAIRIERVDMASDTILLTLIVNNMKLDLLADSDAPIATLIKSGMLDLSKPGNLLKFLPNRPPFILEAEGERIVVDLLKVPALAGNSKLRKLLAVVAPVLGIRTIETDREYLYVALRASPLGVMQAFEALRAHPATV